MMLFTLQARTPVLQAEEGKQTLHYERFHHPHPWAQQKMEALWLKSQELPPKEICQLTCISKTTLCRYLHDYQEGGLERLKELNFYNYSATKAAHISPSYRRHTAPVLRIKQ